jgi:hypothetical protein
MMGLVFPYCGNVALVMDIAVTLPRKPCFIAFKGGLVSKQANRCGFALIGNSSDRRCGSKDFFEACKKAGVNACVRLKKNTLVRGGKEGKKVHTLFDRSGEP